MQLPLFDQQNTKNSVIWDGKKMSLDEAIKWAKLQVKLAPSFPQYQQTLEYLLKTKNDLNNPIHS